MFKKIYSVFGVLLVSVIFFAQSFNYSILNGNTNVGTVTSLINDSALTGESQVELFLSGTSLKMISKTIFNKDWTYKNYNLEMFVDGEQQFTFKSSYDGKNVSNELTGQHKFPDASLTKGIILDNNFIFEHYYALTKNKVSGNINFFVPTVLLNNPSAIPLKGSIERNSNLIKLTLSGIVQNITLENDQISSIEIPSQKFKLVKPEVFRTEIKKDLTGSQVNRNFTEEECSFTSNGFTLNGTVSFPLNREKALFPAIVLVHGSGPNDRNEEFPELDFKPFYELATQLTEKGFIVLRYDKRTYTLIQKGLSDSDVLPNDIINDAKSAVNYLKTVNGVDKNRIFLIGHSEGGGFLPYIANSLNVKGVIALAPNLLPITQQIIYQIDYQINYLTKNNKDGSNDQTISILKKYYEMAVDGKKKFESGKFKDSDSFFGFTGKYTKEWDKLGVNNVELFSKIPLPFLYINGTSDLKCPFELVRENESSLLMNNNLKLVYIPGMEHELQQTLPEIKFEKRLIEEISTWIRSIN